MKNRIYTIQVLEDKDYDALHEQFSNIKKEDLESSLGFADVEKGEAYVRKTNVATLDATTMQHELQELLAKHSEHEIDGIRYKKVFKDIIAPYILPALTALIGGPLLSGLTGLGSTMAGGIAGAVGSAASQAGTTGKVSALPTILGGLGGGMLGAGGAPGIAASKAAGGGFIGQALSGAQSALGITSGAQKALASGLPGAGTAISPIQANPIYVTPGATMTELMTPAQQAAAGVGSAFGKVTSTLGSSDVIPKVLGSAIGQGIGSTLAPVTQPATQTGTQAGAGGVVTQAPKTLIEQAKGLVTPTNILGAGSLLASTMGQQPQFTMPSSFTDLQSKLMSGTALSPLGQQAQSELGNILKSTPQELFPTGTDAYYNTVLTNLDNEYQKQKKALAQQWNQYDPNYMRNGEYILADQQLNKSYMEVKNNYVAQEEQRRFELGRTTKYQAIQDALGVNKNVMDDLLGLTGLDVQMAAQLYGAQVADVEELRKALGTLGSELLIRGTTGQGIKSTGGVTINLAK